MASDDKKLLVGGITRITLQQKPKHPINRIITTGYSGLERTIYGQINYDANACYDHILPILACVVRKSFGKTLLRHLAIHGISFCSRFKKQVEIFQPT
jgi:hypothetical protein